MGAVTVITSGKGGVGKSTVTANLGAALARRAAVFWSWMPTRACAVSMPCSA